jgi:Flp pilus assembly protein TadG
MLRGQARNVKRDGATIVEAAVVLSALLILLFAIFEYGRFIMLLHLVDNAAREGTRLAVSSNVHDTNSFNYQTTATIQSGVIAAIAGQDTALSGLTIQVYLADASGNNIGLWTDAKVGQNIAVQIDATYTPMLPGFYLPFFHQWIGFFPNSVSISTKSVMQTEAN